MSKHSEPLFQKSKFSPPGMINISNIFITSPKTFNLSLGVAGKEILTLSALSQSHQFLLLSDRTNCRSGATLNFSPSLSGQYNFSPFEANVAAEQHF